MCLCRNIFGSDKGYEFIHRDKVENKSLFLILILNVRWLLSMTIGQNGIECILSLVYSSLKA